MHHGSACKDAKKQLLCYYSTIAGVSLLLLIESPAVVRTLDYNFNEIVTNIPKMHARFYYIYVKDK